VGERTQKTGRGRVAEGPPLRAVAEGLSDVGLQREHNEDSFVVMGEFELYVVADGMGGHRAGDVASKLATETISEFFRQTANDDVTWPFHFDPNLSEEENRLLTGIRVANRQIYERSTRSREYHGMGTTVVGAMFSARRRRIYIGHVGDSRAYRVRDHKIAQLTRDHSLINDYLLAMPDLTEEQRSELPKNVITRALGMQDQVVVDLSHDIPQPGDVYLLCSDGLSGMVSDEEINDIISSTPDVKAACQKLIDRANEQGGEDNVTAVLVRIELASTDGRTEEIPAARQPLASDAGDLALATTGTIAALPTPDIEGIPAVTPSAVATATASTASAATPGPLGPPSEKKKKAAKETS
jgi:protein phosphatase